MTRVLPPILHASDLPEAELHAARLDGELYGIGEGFAPVDGIESAAHRAMSLAAATSSRLVAERYTAGWIFGARDRLPAVLEFCTDCRARYRGLTGTRIAVREVVLHEGDTLVLGGVTVTSPVRTILDVARTPARFGPDDIDMIRRLAAVARVGLSELRTELRGRRRLPHKMLADRRLDMIFTSASPLGPSATGPQPADTRYTS
jgi:hypothetical protein